MAHRIRLAMQDDDDFCRKFSGTLEADDTVLLSRHHMAYADWENGKRLNAWIGPDKVQPKFQLGNLRLPDRKAIDVKSVSMQRTFYLKLYGRGH